MPALNNFDIGHLLVPNKPLPTQEAYKPQPRLPAWAAQYQQHLAASVESILETNIPSPSLDNDPDLFRLMSPFGSPNKSRQEVLSSAYTLRADSPTPSERTDRDSVGSVYFEYRDDLTSDCDFVAQHQLPLSHSPCEYFSLSEQPHSLNLRPASILPAPQVQHQQDWDADANLYSAPLRLPRSDSSAKRSITPAAVESLREELYDQYNACDASRRSSETRPTTPSPSWLPALSFCSSTGTSPSSIMTYTSTQDGLPKDCMAEHVEKAREKTVKSSSRRRVLGVTQPRNISSPIPCPNFLDMNSAATAEYMRASTPSVSPPPLQPIEVSMFDDSDDEEGKMSYGVRIIKSAVSLQNLHNRSRNRGDSSSRATTPTTLMTLTTGVKDNDSTRRGSKNSGIVRTSAQSNVSLESTRTGVSPFSIPVHRVPSNATACNSTYIAPAVHISASSGKQLTSPVARLHRHLSSRRERSNGTTLRHSTPTPPPNTPSSPTPKLTTDRKKRHMSAYHCFSRPDSTQVIDLTHMTKQQRKRISKMSKRSIKGASPSRVRGFFTRVFRLRK